MMVLYLDKEINFARVMMFIFYMINIVGEAVERLLIRMVLRKMRKSGFNQKHILLVEDTVARQRGVYRQDSGKSTVGIHHSRNTG